MKVTFKDLKQQKFTLDVEPTELISAVKQKISEQRGWAPETQKLIYSGKILKNEDTVESYKIEEKGFVVCVVNKPKPAPAQTPAAESSRSAVPATPAQATTSTPSAPAAPSQNAPGQAAAPATPTPVRSADATTRGPGGDGGLTMGAQREEAMANLENMGFPRSEVEVAMRAAFFNPERAVEYLLGGLPEDLQQQQQGARGAAQAGAAEEAGADAPAAGGDDDNVNLFDLAAQAGRGAGAGGARGASGGAAAEALAAAAAGQREQGLGNLDFLRHNPQFQQLRQVVQQQPQMLEPILQQLGAGNPQLAQLIAQNQDQFLNLLGEAGGDDEAPLPPGARTIAVTEEQRDAIERLCRLGFDMQQATEAYFACDQNEELAANFLFDQPDADEENPGQ